jgi:tripartite-type tricarboxylate transporter receptor subunit TctC
MCRLIRCGLVAASLFGAPAPAPALAQDSYPDKPVHLIIAFVPGGATDTLARQLQNDLQTALGAPVVIENRPGAGGTLAWNYVASS